MERSTIDLGQPAQRAGPRGLPMYRTVAVRSKKSGTPLEVLLLAEGNRKLPEDVPHRASFSEGLATPGFKREPGEIALAGPHTAIVGVGDAKGINTQRLRKTGAKLLPKLHRMGARGAHFELRALPKRTAEHEDLGRALAEGLDIANWRMDLFDGAASKHSPAKGRLTLSSNCAQFTQGLRTGLLVGDSVNYARKIAATPPNICTPAYVANAARSLARAHNGLSCSVITYQQARRMGMGGLLNVGKGSANKPCIILLDWKPTRAKTKERLALVGKTITYDTGGYSMKSGAGMRGMKYDKNGGMAVLGAMKAVAQAKLPLRVIGVLPAAENMVSSDSYRPDDIIEMFNGITVEVTNTDAEGRLVLADALSYACRKYKPTAIVDVATLTGGIVVALGPFCSGYWCEDRKLRDRLEAASVSSNEKIWQMPLWPEHREYMRSKHADLLNSNPKRAAHPIQGAAFLSYFVDEGIPWAHLDIAGTSVCDSPNAIFPAGPTGYGVRLLFDLASSYVL